jgi:hypothetical protein
MLLGGKGGCQQCTCVPCDPCTRTCQNPHTGTAFEAVYTRYFEGAEAGNTSDGYLSASGDSDTSDPYDGMDGTGPWFQEVSGSFTLDSTQTRFPCRVTVSFWRNNYVLGASTIPPASTALTFEGVFVEVSSGAVVVGDTLIVPADGEVQITGASIPLVSGGGDQSENIPLFYNGSISVAPQCQSASFSIRAKIEWNTQKRQHVLYGLVRECYEDATPCDGAFSVCGSGNTPDSVYVTLSGLSVTSLTSTTGSGTAPTVSEMNSQIGVFAGTFVLSRVAGYCQIWRAAFVPSGGCPQNNPYTGRPDEWNWQVTPAGAGSLFASFQVTRSGVCEGFLVINVDLSAYASICDGFSANGTASSVRYARDSGFGAVYAATVSWEITA